MTAIAPDAYPLLVRHLRAMRRYDLLLPLASLLFTLQALAILVARAEADHDLANARRLKTEVLRQRASFERAVHHVVEAVGDSDGGTDLVDELLGGDGRTLAQMLLDE